MLDEIILDLPTLIVRATVRPDHVLILKVHKKDSAGELRPKQYELGLNYVRCKG